ncbi:MAG: hypothetical protein EZS28_006438 [Streblomastix strix]|uniref:Uncharacterized protein n=1 Tax=Streblomastix strix TaxID=222440 RepID=A0A5J4WSY8_9EUKA|nr:MAG: hypothetical protein EZS28_006438 [Streblomastix strix]
MLGGILKMGRQRQIRICGICTNNTWYAPGKRPQIFTGSSNGREEKEDSIPIAQNTCSNVLSKTKDQQPQVNDSFITFSEKKLREYLTQGEVL